MPFNEYGSRWIRRTRRLALYMRDGFTCVYCGLSMLDHKPDNIELDHVDGTEYFGSPVHTNDNLVTCCQGCNRSKRDLPLDEWAAPDTVVRVVSALLQPVPQILAIAIVRQSTPTKRLTLWRVAVRKAQSHIVLSTLSSSGPGPVRRNPASRGAGGWTTATTHTTR